MDKRNLTNSLLIGFILLAFSCTKKNDMDQSGKALNNQFVIEDTTLMRIVDQYVAMYKFKPENCLLRLFIANQPWEKSFIIMNSYSADDLRIKPCTYYSKYKGFDVAVYTGINNFIPRIDSIPNELNRFLNQELHTYNYFPYRYLYDQFNDRDTFYQIETNFHMVNPKPIKNLKFKEPSE